jgi:hypothetical protein
MSIPKSKTGTSQQSFVSDHDRIQPLGQGEVRISYQSHHGAGPLASDQGILRPAPWVDIQQFVLEGQRAGFPSVLPPLIPPDSDPNSDEEYGIDPPEFSFDGPQSLKRAYPFIGAMSPTELAGVHCATMRSRGSPEETSHRGLPLPQLQLQLQLQPHQVPVFDADEFDRKLLASRSSGEVNEASQLPESRKPGKVTPDLAMPPKSQLPHLGNLMRFSQGEIVDALRELELYGHQTTVARLQDFNDLDEIVECVKALNNNGCKALLTASRRFQSTNPEASQVLALLFLITRRWPACSPDEFLDLLPGAWPPAMEKWLPCLREWNLVRANHLTPQRRKVFLKLRSRYGQ